MRDPAIGIFVPYGGRLLMVSTDSLQSMGGCSIGVFRFLCSAPSWTAYNKISRTLKHQMRAPMETQTRRVAYRGRTRAQELFAASGSNCTTIEEIVVLRIVEWAKFTVELAEMMFSRMRARSWSRSVLKLFYFDHRSSQESGLAGKLESERFGCESACVS